MSRVEFAKELSKSFLGVWVDELASFGTFPLESIKCNTPVIGKIPRLVPEWMGSIDQNGNLNLIENGIWTNSVNTIPDLIATMVGLFLEDALPQNILNGMEEYKTKYSVEDTNIKIKEVYQRIFDRRIVELGSLIKLQEAKENKESLVENNV